MSRSSALRAKGFALAASLILLVLILLLGIGFLGQRPSLYGEVVAEKASSQARAAALAGMEDARVKLSKDLLFPPSGSSEQFLFSYCEDLLNSSGAIVGGYRVNLDRRWVTDPYAVLKITCQGWAGSSRRPSAQHQIYAELDIRANQRGLLTPNPNFFHYIHWVDSGDD